MAPPLERDNPRVLVSIILCTFNRAHLIKRAIASVLAQSFEEWELIVVDDGSNDGTERIVVSLANKDSRLLYVHQKNKGLAEARNVGLALASGTYVTFLDSDDEYQKTHLAKRLSYMEKNSKVDTLHGGIRLVGPRSKHYVPDLSRKGRRIHLSKCFASGTIFAKRSVLRRVGGFRNIGFGEDYDLMKRLMKKHVVRRVQWPTYVYHTESSNRLCTLYEKGGEQAIHRFRMDPSR